MVPIDYDKLLKKHAKGKIYICKPENGCQGQGIYLIDNPNKLERYNNEVVQ
jgi:predicted ATP-grasp superfamily ATP-dependent carboligase